MHTTVLVLVMLMPLACCTLCTYRPSRAPVVLCLSPGRWAAVAGVVAGAAAVEVAVASARRWVVQSDDGMTAEHLSLKQHAVLHIADHHYSCVLLALRPGHSCATMPF
jgi:hypothetical protein